MNKLRIATIGVLTAALLLPVAVVAQEEAPERPDGRMRAAGEISGVVPGQGTFTMLTRQDKELEFQTNGDTKFRGPNGSVEDIHDLKKGMKALVVAAKQDDGTLLALMVGAGNPEDLPDHLRAGGQIQALNPDNQTFALQTRQGETLPFQTGERTKYRGEGIDGFDDLSNEMHAMVVAIPQENGLPLALMVAAGNPKDRPDWPELDVKAGGEVTAVGGSSLTIETRDGESISFSVNDSTHFKGIGGLEELKVGMMAAVGANETDDGLLALVVGARHPGDRPNPHDRPGRGPDRRGPRQGQGQEAEVSA